MLFLFFFEKKKVESNSDSFVYAIKIEASQFPFPQSPGLLVSVEEYHMLFLNESAGSFHGKPTQGMANGRAAT